MALTTFDVDVENVAKLSTHPNSDDGYSPDGLKSVFDKGSVDIKDFINNVLIPELVEQIAAAARGIATDSISGSILTNHSITENKLSQEEGLEAVSTDTVRQYAITKEKLSQALQQLLDTMTSNIQTLQEQMLTKAADSSLAAVAKSGSYNDLSSKPFIPTIDASVVSGSTNGLQSRLVQDLVNAKANTNHASAGTGYGLGNANNYGHLKLSDAVNSTSNTGGGIAATPAAVKSAYDRASTAINNASSANTNANGRAPTNHASSGTGYGVGNATNYGHLKLSDAVNSTSGTNGGIAATPNAVKAAYDLANSKAATNHASSGTGYGVGNNTNYGHLKLSAATNGTEGVSNGTAATPSAVKAAYDLASGKQAQHLTRSVTFNSGATSRTLTVSGVTANNSIIVSPAPASFAQWVDNRMRVSAQGTDSITVVADTAPSANVTINVLILS